MFKLTIAIMALVLVAGCGIPKEQHNAVLKDLEETKIALAETEQAKAELEKQLQGELDLLESRVAELEQVEAALQAALEESQGSLSMYESKTGSLEEALQATRAELGELRKARAQAEKRLAMYRDLANRLASMVESGQLSVKIRDGKMVIELANNILFESGSTKIKDEGKEALQQLSEVLASIERSFLIAGHTDNVPISSGRFKSNWELSTARAVEVVTFLQESGVSPRHLAAAGYGEHDPVADNESPESRALNRRIEIILMPNIEEMPNIPQDVLEGS